MGDVLNLFLGSGRGKSRRCFLLVWHAVVWTIWRYRSDFIFSGKVILEPHLVDLIKFTSCKCFFWLATWTALLLLWVGYGTSSLMAPLKTCGLDNTGYLRPFDYGEPALFFPFSAGLVLLGRRSCGSIFLLEIMELWGV